MTAPVGKTLRHPRTLDVDMKVLEVESEDEDAWELWVVWENRNYPMVKHQDKIRLKKSELYLWEVVSLYP
jgi:hypothetical protein